MAARRKRAVEVLHALGGVPREWSNAPGVRYVEHFHPYFKVSFCIEGSIRFCSPSRSFDLGPGDRLDLPPGVPHSAVVGPDGVLCVEAGVSDRPPDLIGRTP